MSDFYGLVQDLREVKYNMSHIERAISSRVFYRDVTIHIYDVFKYFLRDSKHFRHPIKGYPKTKLCKTRRDRTYTLL